MSKRKNKQNRKKQAGPQESLPKGYALYVNRAETLYSQGQTERAIQSLERADKMYPDDFQVKRRMGHWLAELQRFDSAAKYLENAHKLDPDDTQTQFTLGSVYKDLKKLDKAEPLLTKAVENAPDKADVLIQYANLQQGLTHLEEANTYYRKGLYKKLEESAFKPEPASQKNGDFDKPEYEALMWQTLTDLAKSGVHAFACFGTLLGIIREGGLLPFDKDIDFGLPLPEMERAISCLEAKGWVDMTMHQLFNPRPLFHPPTGLALDISGFTVDKNNNSYEGFWINDKPVKWWRILKFPSMKLQKATSPEGEPIWSLSNYDDWLTAIYGDWRTPDPNFDSVICAQNLCGFSPFVQCYSYLRIHKYWVEGKFAKSLSTIKHTLDHFPDDDLLLKLEKRLIQDLEQHQAKQEENGETFQAQAKELNKTEASHKE